MSGVKRGQARRKEKGIRQQEAQGQVVWTTEVCIETRGKEEPEEARQGCCKSEQETEEDSALEGG